MSFFSSALNDSLWGCRNPLTNLLIFWKKSPTEASAVPILLLSGKSTGCKERRRQNPTDQATFLHFAVSCVILFMEEKGRERIGGTENAYICFGNTRSRVAHGNSGGSLLFLYSEKRSIKGKSALESGCGLPCFVSLRFCGACLCRLDGFRMASRSAGRLLAVELWKGQRNLGSGVGDFSALYGTSASLPAQIMDDGLDRPWNAFGL